MANKHLVFWISVVSVFLVDRITKQLVRFYLEPNSSINYGLFSLTHIYNKGTLFGLLKNASWVFALFAILVSLYLIIKYNSFASKYTLILGLIVGGALGNLFDRILYGAVLDFFDVHFWPVFNVADSAISISVVILILIEYWPKRKI